MVRLIRALAHPAAAPRRAAAPGALTYPEVGATGSGRLPDGYRHLHHTVRIGHGRKAFETAGAAVTTWRMHRASGARVHAEAARAEPGALVEVSVTAFSRPAALYTRLAGPLAPAFQRAYARRLGRTLRRIVEGEK
ncbi:DUF1990 family protein [Streptomyces sp. NPDC003027]